MEVDPKPINQIRTHLGFDRQWKLIVVKQNCRSMPPLRNDGAVRRLEGRIESCFRLQDGSQSATRWRVLGEPQMRPVPVVVAHILGHQPLQMPLIQERLRGPASLAGNSPPNAQQPRSATDCERQFALAGFPSRSPRRPRRRQTLSRGRTAGTWVPARTAMLPASATRSKGTFCSGVRTCFSRTATFSGSSTPATGLGPEK